MTDGQPSPEKLEKEVRALRRKLERSEWHRADLENQHDRDQHLYRRLHSELEAAHREAEVQAALERVRARAMAMRASEELLEVIFTIHREYSGLGFDCGAFWQTRYTDESYHKALTGLGGDKVAAIMELPRDFASNPALAAWERGDEVIGVFKFDAEAACQYHHHMVTKGKYFEVDPEAITQEMIRENHGWTFVQARTSHGEIGYSLWGETDPTEEAKDVLVRFAKTFDLAYRRFLDLEQAEERAREARTQLALERIRTQSMRMQHSSELVATSSVFHEQLLALGVASEFSYVWLPDESAGKHQFWATWAERDADGETAFRSKAVTYDLDKSEPYTAACFAAWESDDPICVAPIPPEEVEGFFAAWPELLDGAAHMKPELFPDGLFYAEAYMRFGCFGINIRKEPTPREQDIIRRFATEFEQAYTRFLDLQRAEAQAHQAVREAALDRVRAEIASMRTAADLERITPIIWRELTTLGVPFFRCGIFIMDEGAREIEAFLTTPDGQSLAALRLPYDIAPTTTAAVDHWRKGEPYTTEWDREQFLNWVHTIMSRGMIADERTYEGNQPPPETLVLQFAPFEQGMLYVGSKSPLDAEALDSVRALAESFAVAYARYEDFQRLEAKNREVEQAMAELRAAQQQLVQQEKMASLGALTAGIAHEIKNPLNFVNNFAALSQELIDELNDEPDLEERAAILDDLKQNAASIEEHGRRADAIVRSMMDHARTGSGDRRMVPLNELVDEYVNLAYHGRRARDSAFNVDLVQQLSDAVGEIELLPQEIGRVLINLLDNAFDAVSDRAGEDSYEPTVTVSTAVVGKHVELRVADNGTGIPDEVKAKVFEPFFTTKPTGQGTGLGLSLSYDVITQGHGGSMIVESEKGVGTTFVIALPLKA